MPFFLLKLVADYTSVLWNKTDATRELSHGYTLWWKITVPDKKLENCICIFLQAGL
jgi:hypothetical protein